MSKRIVNSLYEQALQEAKKKRPDDEKVFSLLTKSLESGEIKAAYALGTWYLHGKHVKRNIRRAVQLLKQAAQENIPDALYDLAVCYEKGVGTRKNEKKAFECYLRASLYGDVQSIYEVGRCYYYGVGVSKDKYISKIWFDRAKVLGITE